MRRRVIWGRTLVELMTAASLMLLITGACALALRSAGQYFRRVEAQTEMENQLTMTVGMLAREIGETSARTLDWTPSPAALTFATPRDGDGRLQIDHTVGNTLLYSSFVHYAVNTVSGNLERFIDPIPVPVSLPPSPLIGFAPPRNPAYFQGPGISKRIVAKGVTDFEITGYSLDEVTSVEKLEPNIEHAKILRVRLRMERQFSRLYGVETTLELVPKN